MLCTHGITDGFCETVIYNSYYYTAASSTKARNSQLVATSEQNVDLDPEWLELRTTLHACVVYARRTLASTNDSCQGPSMDLLVSYWAPKKSRSLPTLRLIETLWSQASVVHHTRPTLRRTAHARLIYHTHIFTTFVDSCKDDSTHT